MASLKLSSTRIHMTLAPTAASDLLDNFEEWASKLKYSIEDWESIRQKWTANFYMVKTRRLTWFNPDDFWLPIFSQLSLMVMNFENDSALDESFLKWLHSLDTCKNDGTSSRGFPFPCLDTLKLQLKFPYHDNHRFILEESESMMRARLAGGLPLQLVEIWETLDGSSEPRQVQRITLQDLQREPLLFEPNPFRRGLGLQQDQQEIRGFRAWGTNRNISPSMRVVLRMNGGGM